MNVLETLHQELKDKNWTKEEKARYIYLRSCELFSYDPRYYFCSFIDSGDKLKDKINQRKINLENVRNFHINCKSFSEQVIPPLFQELLNIPVSVKGTYHYWNEFAYKNIGIQADSTADCDLTRVKMNLDTYGYSPISTDDNFTAHLKEIDKKIHYIEDEYYNYYLSQRAAGLYEEFLNSRKGNSSKEAYDYFLFRINIIKEAFKQFPFTEFYDAEFCIEYLQIKFLEDIMEDITQTYLFQKSKNRWQFVNIYSIPFYDDVLYFILEQEKNTFRFYEIPYSTAKQYAESLNGKNREILLNR